uniref:DNA 3'-5' helicase n=1 Tax=Spongospora subterranea TaxID=70186 RepID=A0A0H5QMZ0_9EUKA|eukprot:CRZ02746.1 hypothetical protein [Spongospora subterranea]
MEGSLVQEFFREQYGTPQPKRPRIDISDHLQPAQESLRSLNELELIHRSVFSGYKTFNRVQSIVFEDLYHSDKSIVVAAPTASGKTVLFELAILRLFSSQQDRSRFKAVYIAPLKALCNEKLQSWQSRFGNLGLKCCEFTGDSNNDVNRIASNHIIITTPEKLDASSRRWQENKFFFDNIGLMMIDEVHTVGEPRGRGICLEALITRCLTMGIRKKEQNDNCPASTMRFVAVSATVPNADELGSWLQAKHFQFGDNFRPVPLQYHVFGYPIRKQQSYYPFDMSLNYKVFDIIRQYSSGRPALVFCSSRAGCLKCAKQVLESAASSGFRFVKDHEHEQSLKVHSQQLKDASLRDIFCRGVAIHTAALSAEDRQLILGNFVAGRILVLCATTTLAQGVNLPAGLVIVKGTQVYNKSPSGFTEHSSATILQMIGRAGRPQFDDFGVAIVMTTANMGTFYENLLKGQKPIESHLLAGNAAEHLNAEISMRTINTVHEAVKWMQNTFGSVRMKKCPSQFGISAREIEDPAAYQTVLENRIRHSIATLESAGMVESQLLDSRVIPTRLGVTMAKFYLKIPTARLIADIPRNIDMCGLINIIASSIEFVDMPIRQGEKAPLNAANNKETIRFAFKGKVKTLVHKISILLLCALQSASSSPFQLNLLDQDLKNALDIAKRITRAVTEYHGASDKSFSVYLNSLLLHKAFERRMWHDSQYSVRQIEGIGMKKAAQLIAAGITSIDKLREISSGKIEALCDRNPPFGFQVKQRLCGFPMIELRIQIPDTTNTLRSYPVKIMVQQICPDFCCSQYSPIILLAGLSDDRHLLSRKFNLPNGTSSHEYSIMVPSDAEGLELHVHAIHEDKIGCDQHVHQPLCMTSNDVALLQPSVAVPVERLAKKQDVWSQQTKFMRQQLASIVPESKKMRLHTATRQTQPEVSMTQNPQQRLLLSHRTNSSDMQSNIGYSRPRLGITSWKLPSPEATIIHGREINADEMSESRANQTIPERVLDKPIFGISNMFNAVSDTASTVSMRNRDGVCDHNIGTRHFEPSDYDETHNLRVSSGHGAIPLEPYRYSGGVSATPSSCIFDTFEKNDFQNRSCVPQIPQLQFEQNPDFCSSQLIFGDIFAEQQ